MSLLQRTIVSKSSTLARGRGVVPPSWTCRQQRQAFSSIGRMLDMGGAPSAGSDNSFIRTHQASKNSKLQAVAFDFHALTSTLEQQQQLAQKKNKEKESAATASSKNSEIIQPDLGMIENVANLLNIDIDTKGKEETATATQAKQKDTNQKSEEVFNPTNDIRAKYAHKLKGGLAGIELAKNQVHETLQKGDAAGHFAARKIASETAVSSSGSKWMALTGTGQLLSYLSHRSIQIALLDTKVNPQLHEFPKQLPDVVMDVLMDDYETLTNINSHGNDDSSEAQRMVQYMATLLERLENINDPTKTLVVSSSDAYLKAARDVGMMTCRLQPKNARRGNLTCHYTVPSILDVQEVVNEINGISFNVTLNR